MKTSKYNIIFETSPEESLVFNGMTKKFFSLSNDNIVELKKLFESPNIYFQREEYNEFLSTLKNNGFLIEDDVDEFEQLRSLFESYKEAKSYSLMILTSYSCNFSCWYCVQKHKNEYLNTDSIEKIKKHISKYLIENNIHAFHISWFGGEPLLNFDAIRKICIFAQDFCDRHEIGYSCGITTNGSLITPDIATQMKELGFIDFQITIDGIKENHNKTRYNHIFQDSFSIILNNINTLAKTIPEVDITVRFNYTHKNLNEVLVEQIDSVLFSSRDKVKLFFRKVWQEPDSTELSEKLGIIMSKFQAKGYTILHDYDNLKLTSCYVEQTHYNAIFPDGTVDKCSNKDMAETRGYLLDNGEIKWECIPTENEINIFNYPSECSDCVYLPLCMGPCPRNRESFINKNTIRCSYDNKDQLFMNDIKNFALISKV